MNLEQRSACPICSRELFSPVVTKHMVFPEPLPIAYCSDCQLYYAAVLPDAQFLNDFYEHDYFEQSQAKSFHYRLKTLFASMRAKSQYLYMKRNIDQNKTGSVLEIGAADGTFLAKYKQDDWQVTGLEYNEYMTRQANQRFGIVMRPDTVQDCVKKHERYDHVVMLHVLEHMRDPLDVLKQCRELLHPEGYLYIEVPHSPEPEDVPHETLDFYLTTTHLYNFRLNSLKMLCEQAGFSIKCVDRYFYPVPEFFSGSSEAVGRILMNGSVHSAHPKVISALTLTCTTMLINHLADKDTMNECEQPSPWKGVGDNLRLIAHIKN